jgi:hypothetical protein
MTCQRLATLLGLKVSVTRSGFWVAVIEHVAAQVQRSAILGKPRPDGAPQVMDADILQSRAFANALQRFTKIREVRAGLEAANDMRIPINTRNKLETSDRGIAQGCEEWFAVFRESNEQGPHVPIHIDPLCFQKFRAAQTSK